MDPNCYNFTVGMNKYPVSRYLQQLECAIKISMASINDKITGISNTLLVFFFPLFIIKGNAKDQSELIKIKM